MMNKSLLWLGGLGIAMMLGACGGGGSATATVPGGATPTPSSTACAGGKLLTFAAGSGVTDPFKNADKVCFTTASSTTLAFNGKTLSSPTQNTAVTAPFSAWKFMDGVYTYEVIFEGSTLHEINVSKGGSFVGQFDASAPV